jgi:hypothetical protein
MRVPRNRAIRRVWPQPDPLIAARAQDPISLELRDVRVGAEVLDALVLGAFCAPAFEGRAVVRGVGVGVRGVGEGRVGRGVDEGGAGRVGGVAVAVGVGVGGMAGRVLRTATINEFQIPISP